MRPADFLEHWRRINLRALYRNFKPREVPLMVFDGADTWLFGSAQAPTGFAREEEWFRYSGRFNLVTANTAADGVALVMESDPLEAAYIAAHEAFHVFQAQHFPHRGANETEALTYPTTDVQALLERRLETVALYRAVETLDAGWALEALHWRERRYQRLSASAVLYERELERHEGLAFFVELNARGIKHRLPEADFPAEDVRRRAYATGQVMARLLEGWQPDYEAAVEHAYLDQLLREIVKNHQRKPLEPDLIAVQLERAILEVERVQLERSQARQSALQSAALSLEVTTREPLFPQGFDPMNLRLLSENEVLHARFLQLGNASGSLELFSLSAITRGAGQHPLFDGVGHVTIALPERPTITDDGHSLELHGQGLTLRFTGANLERASKTWRVQLR